MVDKAVGGRQSQISFIESEFGESRIGHEARSELVQQANNKTNSDNYESLRKLKSRSQTPSQTGSIKFSKNVSYYDAANASNDEHQLLNQQFIRDEIKCLCVGYEVVLLVQIK